MKSLLKQLHLNVDVVDEQHTGNVSRYFLKLLGDTSLSRLENRATEMALGLKAFGKPLIYPILSRGMVVMEFITKPLKSVHFNEFDISQHQEKYLPAIIGKIPDGKELVIDLADNPHILVAGSTGSGKSVLLNSIICSLLESGKDIRLALIDPKKVEFNPYRNVKQLMYPIANTFEEAEIVLDNLISEMEERFSLLAQYDVTNIKELMYKQFPYVAIIVDEFADLSLASKEISNKFCMLAQKSRAAGLIIVAATQRPSVAIINGSIKTNFQTRISFKLPSSVDSRVILSANGAERLFSKGDGLFTGGERYLERFKGALVEKDDIAMIALKNKISLGTRVWRRIKDWTC